MSYRKDKELSLINTHNSIDSAELAELFKDNWQAGIHGIAFSAYEEGQEPGVQITEAQIRKRMKILQPHVHWIRSFSCTDGNEMIPVIAKEYGIKTLVGAWLSDDTELNQREMNKLIELAQAGFVDIAAVGNEVLYRQEMTEDELLHAISSVKGQIKDIPVAYVDAYYEFENRPRITEICDVILANCYPFWEGCHSNYAILYMQDMYRRAVKAGKGKKVIISECGWPNKGQSHHGAHPSDENAMKYFINTQNWSREYDVEVFYFSSFDEAWKIGDEGDVGAYWGVYDKDENLKYQ
jgi:glucan 1,3-beta-glucosidase|tara:strand:+ start:196 stop:1080 length:885 start_codon:yes stop_codon:yes gene_type:complete